jgi:hypothetical protein
MLALTGERRCSGLSGAGWDVAGELRIHRSEVSSGFNQRGLIVCAENCSGLQRRDLSLQVKDQRIVYLNAGVNGLHEALGLTNRVKRGLDFWGYSHDTLRVFNNEAELTEDIIQPCSNLRVRLDVYVNVNVGEINFEFHRNIPQELVAVEMYAMITHRSRLASRATV